MKKKLIMLLISVCLLMSLVSCKKDKNTDSEAQGEESSEELEDLGSYNIDLEEDEEGGFAPN